MREASLQRVSAARAVRSLDKVVCSAREMPLPCGLRPAAAGFDLIAEVKKASPSEGRLSHDSPTDLIARALGYAEAGALAVSVLTEPDSFGGDMEHLRAISAALRPQGVPVMRKDFLVDSYQVWEAAAAGASGVLLIVRMLDDPTIMEMLEAAEQNHMFVLLEAFDERDLLRAHPFVGIYERVLMGLNSRDLDTLEVDAQRLFNLADRFPPDCLRVAESGIANAEDAAALAGAGYDLALVGSALMRSAEPGGLIRHMLTLGRRARHT